VQEKAVNKSKQTAFLLVFIGKKRELWRKSLTFAA
jgi:hypothetical protein